MMKAIFSLYRHAYLVNTTQLTIKQDTEKKTKLVSIEQNLYL